MSKGPKTIAVSNSPGTVDIEVSKDGFIWDPSDNSPGDNVYTAYDDIIYAATADDDDFFADDMREWDRKGILDG